MEEKKRVIYAPLRSVQSKRPLDVLHPGEVCAACPERDNHCRKAVLSAQKSAEAVVARWNKFPLGEGPNQQES